MTPGRRLLVAVRTETRKLAAARVPLATAALFIIGVTAISLSVVLAAGSGSEALVAKLGPLAASGGWEGYLASAAQVAGAGGFLGCGVVVSWLYGREFSDGTAPGLFALPVRLAELATAKLLVFLGWAAALACILPSVLLGTGMVAGFGAVGAGELGQLGRLAVLIPLTALMSLPCAWIATLTRGPLGGIATAVVLVAASQILVISGSGAWFPPAAPALWALEPDAVDAVAVWASLWLPLVAATLTAASWHRLQLDRP